MSDARQQWLLKVIAGPHQGAEIGLYAGKTLVGSDDECDVILHDVLVAPQHMEIELTPAGITAAPLGGRVFVNGKRIRDARQAVPGFSFLSIGGSHLVIGPAEGKWPLLSAADVPDLEKEAESASAAPEKETAAAVAAVPTPPAAVPAAQSATASSRLGPVFGIAAGLLLLLGWAVVYHDSFSTRSLNAEEPQLAARPLDRARVVVEELGLAGSITLEENAGRLTAEGYVDSENKQRELQAVFRATVPGMRTKIYSLEKIASSARSLLDNQHLPLTVSSLSEGKLKVTGKLPSADVWVRMKQTLQSEVPGISEIEDGVEIEAPYLKAPGQVQHSASPVPLPGTLAAPGSAPVHTAAPAPAPVPGVPASAPQPDPQTGYLITADTIDTPESTVVAIRSGEDGLGFIRLSTGGVYFTGARLPYGGTIVKIEPDSVSVIEKGESRTLHPGDAAMKTKPLTTSIKP